ncbi:glycosyl hydrolase family 3 N terminal domain-containing protein [Dactylonectria macrodidyma]|uniref:beta-glucosidase n=1 Tax=Dactylonectria macrodidyma TaxID=307937 RepID=A0A9P9F4B9_9HYPO|nr:glycosyl hydrolase family 3 N terminal domain-containing protein [Dactylonectria macrodidyma]
MGDSCFSEPLSLPSQLAAEPCFDVEHVLKELSSKEKIDLLSGIDFWHTKAIPRLNVPSIRLSDGPNGVRGTRFFNGVPAACFPCGTGLAATWNTDLLKSAGSLMGAEAKAKGVHVLLGPTVNMQRSPLGGRAFESFSEDPVLAGRCAASIISGIEKTGVIASIKHFVANDQEHERMAVDSLVTERALREIYVLPFQIAVRDANPGSFMTSYNKVNGVHVSDNPKLIQKIVRGEWGWDGLVMSDWYGTYSTVESINAGLDLEMPGPSRWRGELVNHALMSKKLEQDIVDQRVREVLKCVHRAIKTGTPENAPEEPRDTLETALLLREIAGQSVVLLKNTGQVLPFKQDKPVAVIGANAKAAVYCGGGSATLRPYYATSPFEGISKKNHDVRYSLGCHAHKMLPMLGPQMRTSDGRPGVTFKAFTSPDSNKNRQPVDTLHLEDTDMYFADYYHPELKEDLWWGEIEALFEADETCEFEFGLCVFGTARLYIDGELLIDNETVQRSGGSFFNVGTVEETGVKKVTAGQTYTIKVVFASGAASTLKDTDGVVSFGGGGVRIGGAKVIDPDEEIRRAVELAKAVDQVVLCVGLNSDFEQEGHDRTHMDLPGRTDELIAAVAAANPRVVVVVQSGSPVTMPWADSVSGVLQAWYGGNETGNAIADVLFGDVNPSGKLPLSFPVQVEDNPAFLNYRSEHGRVLYGEDVYVGYRFYETVKRRTQWSFGWGLSYTTFVLSDLRVQLETGPKRDLVVVNVTVKNTGAMDGSEVVQVYISQRTPSIKRPVKELKGFAKVFVGKGGSVTAKVVIERKYGTSFWDETRHKWTEESGLYDVLVGNCSGETPLKQTFEVKDTVWWSGL